MFLQNTPIRQKLMVTMMMACGAVLLLTCVVLFAVEFVTVRRAMRVQITTLGEVLASNSAASLAFQSQEDAEQVLSALAAEPHIRQGAVYDASGKLFARFPSDSTRRDFPAVLGPDGPAFDASGLVSFQPVRFDNARLGTLYLRSDLEAVYQRLRIYGETMLVIMIAAGAFAYVLAHLLQRQISRPILALEATTRDIAERHDYSTRANKHGDDEVGRLTDSFNAMLGRIDQLNRELEERVAERTAQLTSVNHDLESFSYSVSHDLRAPLRHIGGFATMLERHAGPTLDEKGKRYVTVILESAQRMGRLIDDLLVFARHGRTEMKRETVDLNAMVTELRAGLQAESAGRDLVWQVEPLPVIEGDLNLLRQVFSNLLANAVKYSRKTAQARIEINATTVGDEHVICVRDNGAGFDMKYVEKLFGVFQRLHRDDEFEGTGVGLALVRRIVQRHGGRVWAEGQINRGAAFYVALPIIRTAGTEPAPLQAAPAHP